MRTAHFLTTALAVVFLSACQPAATPQDTAATSEDVAATTEPVVETPAALPCGVQAQRDWTAQIATSGATHTLTVAGVIDLPKPGFGVSLARTDAAGVLSLSLREPTGIVPQVVTPHPVNYFGPIETAGRSIQITCDGAELTNIQVTN